MWSITLVRESDLTTWNALARYPDAAMIDFARQTGLNLYICEGVGPYHIECRDMVSGTKFLLGVVDGVPAVVATFHVVASGYTLTIVEAPDRVRLDVSVSSEDELLARTEDFLRQHNIPSQACEVRRVGWGWRQHPSDAA